MSSESTTETRQVVKATSVVSGLTLVVYATGLVWRWLSAPYLGTLPVANAFNWAYGLVIELFRTWEKLLRPTVIPVFMHDRRERGEVSAWRFISSLLNVQPIILIVLTTLGILFAPQVVGLLSVFKDRETRGLATSMLPWLLPVVPLLSLSVMGYLILNARKRFALAVLGDWVLKLAMVVGLILLYDRWGWHGLVLALSVGAAVKFVMYGWGLVRERGNYSLILELFSPAMRRFALLVTPVAAGALVSMIRNLIELRWRTGVAGGDAASVVVYGRMPVDVPIQILMIPLGIAIFPFISEAAASNRHRELLAGFFSICRGILLVFLPMTVGMILLRNPLIRTLLEWGNFGAADTVLTSKVLFWYAFGYVPFALEAVILPYFFARQKTLIPMVVGMVTSGLNILVLYFMIWHTNLGVGSFTLAMVATKALKMVILMPFLKRLFPEAHDWGRHLLRLLNGLGRVTLATAVMTASVLGVGYLIETLVDASTKFGGLVYLGATSLVGLAVYVVMVMLLRVEEARLILDWVMKKLLKRGVPNTKA